MKFIKELTIAKHIEDVWEVLGNQFGQIDHWASIISKSDVSGPAKIPGVDYSIRTTMTAKVEGKQELTGFNPTKHEVSYKSLSGTPPIIKQVVADWKLTSKGDNSTHLVLDFTEQTKGMGHLLSPIVKMKFGKIGDELLNDFKYYVENGKPSPSKIAAN
ncbi:MAG: SRPBCC family protein [Crocinitomicaceae bacterium]|nr:SRPBCC family protein [Crocinitomicaceae bacterium]